MVDLAIEEGWECITSDSIELKHNYDPYITQSLLKSNRNEKPTATFELFIKGEFIEHLLTATNSNIALTHSNTRGPKLEIIEKDIYDYIMIIIVICYHKYPTLQHYWKNNQSIPMSKSRYDTVNQFLAFNPKVLVEIFNKQASESVTIGQHSVVDESMLRYEGDTAYQIVMPRKPTDTGLRVYGHCFPLTRTNRPFYYYLLLDIQVPNLTSTEVLDNLVLRWKDPLQFTLSGDSYFGGIYWLLANQNYPTTLAIRTNDTAISHLLPLLGYQLKYQEYRIFKKGDVIVTLWLDNALVITASTAFVSTKQHLLEGQYRGYVTSNILPSLSINGIQILEQLSCADLQALAKRLGKPSSKYHIIHL
ncbi:MAG: hypothetical protein H0U71_08325 [Gammaproteobacteria bacterium]|nr:hypothetical protein [Gammaproteobacteria bacterium]